MSRTLNYSYKQFIHTGDTYMNALNKLKNAAQKLKSAEARARIKTALTLGKSIIGATVMESLKKDPRKINCQVAMVTLNFGTDNRLYDVKMLQELTKNNEVLEVNHSQLVAFGNLDETLKSKCFHEDRIMDVDLSYPLIVDFKTGLILDGRHRLAKSKALGHTTIKVVAVDMNTIPYAHKDMFNKMSFKNI